MRLGWNLAIHRPLDFVFSDMKGYLERADLLLDDPGSKEPWLTLFPFGTHAFLFAVKLAFGRDNGTSMGVALAVVGALAVTYTYAAAARLSLHPTARHIAGVVLIFYYPWISFGGYALSEMPFALCIAGAAFHSLRLHDEGRPGDAWWLGAFLAAGAAVRPQILAGGVLLVLHVILRRSAWTRLTRGLAARAALPVAVVLGLSAIRIHAYTGEWGIVSTNGPLNAVFGRCHNLILSAQTIDAKALFAPPSLAALRQYDRYHPDALFKLDPAIAETLTVAGHMWDAAPNLELARSCVERTGIVRQLRYAVTHVVMLWAYNIPWPDQGQRPPWRSLMQLASFSHNLFILPAAIPAVLLAFGRRHARWMLLALHVLGVVAVAVAYFGDTRLRVPYDGLLIVLAMLSYQALGLAIMRGSERLLAPP